MTVQVAAAPLPYNDDDKATLASTSSPQLRPTSRSTASTDRNKRTTSTWPSKMPTLSDIAARLKVERERTSGHPSSPSPSKSSNPEGRPRLGLTGRLNSPSKPQPAAILTGEPSENGKATMSILGPASPSKLNATKNHATESATACGSSSPSKRMAAKGLPSLDEIRERMAKKGLAVSSPDPAAETKESPKTEKEEPLMKAQSPVPSITVADKENSQNGNPIRDTSIMRMGATKPHVAPPVSPLHLTHDPVKLTLERAKTGLASLPPTPRSATLPPTPKAVHPLQHQWTLYFDSKTFNPSLLTPGSEYGPPSSPLTSQPPTPTVSGASWEANLKNLGAYKSVEAFFGTFATLRRPSQLDKNSNYHIFKNGIKPMWEDPCNAKGGKWVLTLKQSNPALLDRSWMWLVIALIGEELDENDEVTGAVCSLRPRGDRIALWIRSKDETDKVNNLGRKMVQLLDLEKEPGISMEFSYNTGQPIEQPSKFIGVHNPPSNGTQQSFNKGGNLFQRHGMPQRANSQVGLAPGSNNSPDASGSNRGTSPGPLGLTLGVGSINLPQRSPIGARFNTTPTRT